MERAALYTLQYTANEQSKGTPRQAAAITTAQILLNNGVDVPASTCIAVMVSATVVLHFAAYHFLRRSVLKADD